MPSIVAFNTCQGDGSVDTYALSKGDNRDVPYLLKLKGIKHTKLLIQTQEEPLKI